jgi:uncharacterized protein
MNTVLGNGLRILFLVLTAALAGWIHVYLYRRLVRDVTQWPRVRRWAKAALMVLAVAAMLVRPVARLFGGDAPPWVFVPLLVWMGLVLYVFLATAALDLARGAYVRWRAARGRPVEPERRAFLATAVAAGSAVIGGGLSVVGTWRAYRPAEVSEVPVRLPGLPKALEGFTLVQLSDIHVGAVIQRSFLNDLVARANALKPDAMAITGDLVDGSVEQLGYAVGALQNLQARRGVYFVTGNHDYYAGVQAWTRAVAGLGIGVLRNRWVDLGDHGAPLHLVGVDDWSSRERGGYDLDQALAGRDPAVASVLLAHQPTNLEEVARRGVGLQLSGHTHGGQMFPATTIARMIWGARNTGLSRHGQSWLYTSRGCGFVGPPMRVEAPPELVKIVLLPA